MKTIALSGNVNTVYEYMKVGMKLGDICRETSLQQTHVIYMLCEAMEKGHPVNVAKFGVTHMHLHKLEELIREQDLILPKETVIQQKMGWNHGLSRLVLTLIKPMVRNVWH